MTPPPAPEPDGIRLTELLAALSLVTDLARGRPADEAMRACLLASAIAANLGLTESERSEVYYTTLLRSVGCTATSHEYAGLFGGNDIRARDLGDRMDASRPREALGWLWATTAGTGRIGHVRAFGSALGAAREATTSGARADCEVGAQMARRLGLGGSIEHALLQTFERWDGKGAPDGLAAERIALGARVAAVAYAAIGISDDEPTAAATTLIRQWSGHLLDPTIAAAFSADAPALLAAANPGDPWQAVVAAEPGRPRTTSAAEFDQVARAFADVVDLKSPFLHGHSAAVADRAVAAARLMHLPDLEVADLGRAGLLHDLGRAGVPTGIWEKPGPLSTTEWEQVRLHPYHTERILGRAPALKPLARLASLHHERLDGSGYHRGAPAVMQDLPARILAAADAYEALLAERPQRPALSPDDAARTLEGESLDADAVDAVNASAGQVPRRPHGSRSGLSPRELEVLGFLVRGRSEKAIAETLVVSASTIHTHITHIYEKTGVRTRAGLAMFAMERDLIRPGSAQEID